jgi:hypothetical protein
MLFCGWRTAWRLIDGDTGVPFGPHGFRWAGGYDHCSHGSRWCRRLFCLAAVEDSKTTSRHSYRPATLQPFDKRYAIYNTVKRLVALTVNDPAHPHFARLVAEYDGVIDEAIFFFSAATCQWLETVRADCKALREADERSQEAHGGLNFREGYPDLPAKMVEHFNALPTHFRGELSFRQLT